MLTRRKFLWGAARAAVAVPVAVAVGTAVVADSEAHPVITEDKPFGLRPVRVPVRYPVEYGRAIKSTWTWPDYRATWGAK